LRGVAAHIDEYRCLERVVWKCAGPGCGAAARDGETVARTSKTLFSRNELVVRRVNTVRQVDQPEEIIGIDRMIARCIPDAIRQILQIDTRAAGVSQFFGNCVEVLDGERAGERFID
jgi:hypothetical protein